MNKKESNSLMLNMQNVLEITLQKMELNLKTNMNELKLKKLNKHKLGCWRHYYDFAKK